MTMLSDLSSAIADDIDDTEGEYGAQIIKAVQAAQRYCERENYYFNETRDQTFDTVEGQEWYGADDNANIPTLVHIHALYSEDGNGVRLKLIPVHQDEIERLSDSSASTGEPYCWAYYGQKIRLYPVPGAQVFTIRMQISPYRLGALSAGTDTNAWLDEAYDLMKARAKYILAKDTLKDAAMAVEALNDYSDQHDALKRETSKRKGTGRIRPTCL